MQRHGPTVQGYTGCQCCDALLGVEDDQVPSCTWASRLSMGSELGSGLFQVRPRPLELRRCRRGGTRCSGPCILKGDGGKTSGSRISGGGGCLGGAAQALGWHWLSKEVGCPGDGLWWLCAGTQGVGVSSCRMMSWGSPVSLLGSGLADGGCCSVAGRSWRRH